MELPAIQLALELAAAEGGVALRVDRLVELEWEGRIGRTHAGNILASVARETTVNEPIELCVIGSGFESEGTGRPPQSDLDRLGSFQTDIGVADVKGDAFRQIILRGPASRSVAGRASFRMICPFL